LGEFEGSVAIARGIGKDGIHSGKEPKKEITETEGILSSIYSLKAFWMPMTSPEIPNPAVNEFAQSLAEVEQSLAQLKERYRQIQERQAERQALGDRKRQLEERLQAEDSPDIYCQLEEVERQLEEVGLMLESNLLSDRQQKQLLWEFVRGGLLGEVFWQIVRFGGAGVVLGWLLKTWSGQ
jgi:ABC-type phosphate transport system auxiliary subunit